VLSSLRMPVLLHATDDVARVVGDLQLTLGEGPSVEAAAHGVPVLVADTESTEQTGRWPALVAELAALDVRALFAFPIRVGSVGLGTLDLYRCTPGALESEQVTIGIATGEAVAGSLLAPDRRTGTGLGVPMTVHRAAGMVMVQLGLGTSIEDALVRLRATAFEEGLEVTAVATQVLDGSRRFAEEGS
jgi:hypothetical protein